MTDPHPWLATLTYDSGAPEQRRFPSHAEAETYVLAAHKRGEDLSATRSCTAPNRRRRSKRRCSFRREQ